MAGEARTSAFMIGEATVMIGPQASLWDLNPTAHSIGLVKNFTMSAEPQYTELTQGVKNQIVYSVLTSNPIRCAMEVFEFTARNFAYGLGLDGSTLTAVGASQSLAAPLVGTAAAGVTTATFVSATSQVANFPAGAWVAIQATGDTDLVHVVKLSAAATSSGSAPTITHTLTFADFGVKTGTTIPAGSRIYRVQRIEVGSKQEQPFLAAKVVGILPEENRPITLLIPKLRITKGFNLALSAQGFGNLPFEFTPYELVSTDPNFSEFSGKGLAAIFPGM